MLVLKRQTDQKTILTLTEDLPAGTRIEVMPTQTAQDFVRLGFTAPDSVNIAREEIIDGYVAGKGARSC